VFRCARAGCEPGGRRVGIPNRRGFAGQGGSQAERACSEALRTLARAFAQFDRLERVNPTRQRSIMRGDSPTALSRAREAKVGVRRIGGTPCRMSDRHRRNALRGEAAPQHHRGAEGAPVPSGIRSGRVLAQILLALGGHRDDAADAFLGETAGNERVDNDPRFETQGDAICATPECAELLACQARGERYERLPAVFDVRRFQRGFLSHSVVQGDRRFDGAMRAPRVRLPATDGSR